MPDWVSHLPWFLFSFRTTPHEKTGFSPAEATFGSPLVLPAQFPFSPEDESFHFMRNLKSSLSGSLSQPPATNTPPLLPPELLSAPMVFVCAPPTPTPIAPAYTGPFKVLRRSPLAFQLQIGDRTDTVSVHRLKPAYLPPDATPAQPPLRGRPPGDLSCPSILKKTPHPPPPPKPPSHVTFSLPETTRSGAPTDFLLIYQISYLHEILGGTYVMVAFGCHILFLKIVVL
jgi:hypothetical protein